VAKQKKLTIPEMVDEMAVQFYRSQAHGLLRRYFYAAMQTSRTASTLQNPNDGGWVSSRPIHSFEDAVIFVRDMERAIEKLPSLDRDILNRVVIQEYTQAEAAQLLGMAARTMAYKFPAALDRLSRKLIEMELLIVPDAA
jgi:DNA-directed RNA polymerase specialized sigma24 family protein